MERKSILNIGAGPGRIKPEILKEITKYFLVNLDLYYPDNSSSDPIKIGKRYKEWFESSNCPPWTIYSNYGWEEFIAVYRYLFDVVTMYRYLEHVKMTQVPYFLYMVSTILKVGGIVEGIVPDYDELSRRILEEDPLNDKNFESKNILNTTELLNEPNDPHASIWTRERLHYFFGLEQRFIIDKIEDDYMFDGRKIYLKFRAKRVA